MIKNIIYVEDGSVDLEDLENSVNEETKIIVYRQGSTPPKIEQPVNPIPTELDKAVYSEMKRLREL